MGDETFSGKTVLLVDDQPTLLEAMAFEIEMLGCQVKFARTGKEALDHFSHDQKIDLVISDVRMPDWDGFRFLTELRKISALSPPFIFMTGFSHIDDMSAFSYGVECFLYKPMDPDQFVESITRVLGGNECKWREKVENPVVDFTCRHSKAVPHNHFQLGRGGIFLSQELMDNFQSLKKTQKIQFDLNISNYGIDSISGFGEIAWIRKTNEDGNPGCGILFSYLDESCRETVLKAISKIQTPATIPLGL